MRVLWIHELIAIAWALTMLAFMFTVGRFAIHWQRRMKIRWDDIFNGIAVLFLLAFTGTYQIYGPMEYNKQLHGLGILKEPPATDPAAERRNTQYAAANTVLFWCTIYSVKASFLALYWQLFKMSMRFRIAWAVVTAYTILSFGVTFFWTFWICGDPNDFLVSEKCLEVGESEVNIMVITHGVLDLFGDVLLMLLPMVMLRPLLMRTVQKVELCIIFGLVIVNIALGILRTVYSVFVNLPSFPDQNVL